MPSDVHVSDFVDLASAVVGAIVVLVSALIGAASVYFATRAQVRGAVVSSNRQEWIRALQLHVADLLAEISTLDIMPRLPAHEGSVTDYTNALRNIQRLFRKVELMTNPQEEDHLLLVSRAEEVLRIGFLLVAADSPVELDDKDLDAAVDALVEQARKVSKAEWEKVKDGK